MFPNGNILKAEVAANGLIVLGESFKHGRIWLHQQSLPGEFKCKVANVIVVQSIIGTDLYKLHPLAFNTSQGGAYGISRAKTRG